MAGSVSDLELFAEDDVAKRAFEPHPNPQRRPIEPRREDVSPSDKWLNPAKPRALATSLAITLALSEIFSRRAALADENRQAPLSRRLSHVPGTISERPG